MMMTLRLVVGWVTFVVLFFWGVKMNGCKIEREKTNSTSNIVVNAY